MEQMYLRVAAAIIALGGVIYAAHIVWVYLLRPVRDFTTALPVLLAISNQFRPNSGTSLRDQVDLVNLKLQNIEQQLEQYIEQSEPWSGEERRDDK